MNVPLFALWVSRWQPPSFHTLSLLLFTLSCHWVPWFVSTFVKNQLSSFFVVCIVSFKCYGFQGVKIGKVLRQGKFCERALNCLHSHFIVSLW